MKSDPDDFKLKGLGDFVDRPPLMLLGWNSIEKLKFLIESKVIQGRLDDDHNYLTSWASISLAVFMRELDCALRAAQLDCLLKGKPFDYDEAALRYVTLKLFGQDMIRNENFSRLAPVGED